MCCLLVSSFLTEITQQIHSLRASRVMSSHFASAAASETRAFRKSAGTVCTTPWEIGFIFRDFGLHPIVVAVVCMVGNPETDPPPTFLLPLQTFPRHRRIPSARRRLWRNRSRPRLEPLAEQVDRGVV